jgi:hypothetical protein
VGTGSPSGNAVKPKPGRRSSAVEHPLRKRVVGGSNPSAGTNSSTNRKLVLSALERTPVQSGDAEVVASEARRVRSESWGYLAVTSASLRACRSEVWFESHLFRQSSYLLRGFFAACPSTHNLKPIERHRADLGAGLVATDHELRGIVLAASYDLSGTRMKVGFQSPRASTVTSLGRSADTLMKAV